MESAALFEIDPNLAKWPASVLKLCILTLWSMMICQIWMMMIYGADVQRFTKWDTATAVLVGDASSVSLRTDTQ